MTTERDVARRLWMLAEPIHAVTYFSPEPLAALRAAGFRGFWMGYFAGRAAPLGEVGAEIVHALFYNFTPERVARALPDAWSHGSPDAALAARLDGSVAALRRCLDGQGGRADLATIGRAAELLSRVVSAQPPEGRALFAANRSLPEPVEPLARLWHAATLLREHRGDGHVAALVAAGIGGRESHVLHALGSGAPRDVYTVARDFSDAEWASCLESLRVKGLASADGLSEEGRRLKREVEARTDDLASAGLSALAEDETDELVALLWPIARAVVAAGDIPVDSPMGLDLRTVAAG
ncbi:MAG TPA: hypothetical protein VNS81_05320 [Nocardioides sp.]|nr:hypothetical protein [Nocardioides sp.]